MFKIIKSKFHHSYNLVFLCLTSTPPAHQANETVIIDITISFVLALRLGVAVVLNIAHKQDGSRTQKIHI